MTRFSTFALLYMAAIQVELLETWPTWPSTYGILLLVVVMAWRGIGPAGFFLFLAAATAQFLFKFPDVANHINISIYCNILLMAAIGYAAAKKSRFPTDEERFELVRPLLQISLVLVYALAGFHKLNHDFLNAEVSCARTMLGGLATVPKTGVLGVPLGIFLAGGLLASLYRLLAESVWRRHLVAAGLGAGLVLAGVTAILVFAAAPGVSPVIRTGVLAMAVVIIVWELGGGLLLVVPRLQAAVVAFSWTMHAALAFIGFADFSALAFALLFTFVPRLWFERLNSPVRLPVLRVSVPRVHLYAALALLPVVASRWGYTAVGILLNAGALVFLWPLLRAAVGRAPRPAWVGAPLTSPETPRWMYLFPLLLLVHGLSAYLGLRSAGNLSMFSNLRTEGERSNHYLLGGNPLKIWNYQEDVVEITRIDDRLAMNRITSSLLEGYRVPVVELRKLIFWWTQAGREIPVTFTYQGTVHTSPDITKDPVWRVEKRDWEMRLMDFRVIQTQGPNQCRW